MAKPELTDHPKFKRLVRLLSIPAPHVLGHLEFLWNTGYQTGNPVVGDAIAVEDAAEWHGETGKFTAAALEALFLDKLPDGQFEIHNLYKHAPKYAKIRMHRKGTAPVEWPSVQNIPRAISGKNVPGNPQNVPIDGTDVPRNSESVLQPNQILSLNLNQNQPPTPSPGETGSEPKPKSKPRTPTDLTGFSKFWEAYPKKVAKPAAEKAWLKFDPDEATRAAIMAAIAHQRASQAWTKDNGEFIPHPATWLNGRRWEDQAPEAIKPPVKTATGFQRSGIPNMPTAPKPPAISTELPQHSRDPPSPDS